VIAAEGEYFTHSVVSHGPDVAGTTWGSMDTMKLPRSYPAGDTGCNHPVEGHDLANGSPGARTDNSGGLWGYYFSTNGYAPGWQNDGNNATNKLGSNASVAGWNGTQGWAWGQDSSGQHAIYYLLPGATNNSGAGNDLTAAQCLTDYEKNKMAGCGANCWSGLGYSVYAYSSLTTENGSGSYGYGTMCSGLISGAYYWATSSAGSYCTPNSISSFTYPNSSVVAGANALYNAVQNNSQGFWGTLGACIACFDCNLLDEAGDQIVNAFAYSQGTDATMEGHAWAGNSVSGHTATTVSPDRLAGASGQYSTTPANNSPWQPAAYNTLLFNQPGNVYGCWY
jgi:hypothetical protein